MLPISYFASLAPFSPKVFSTFSGTSSYPLAFLHLISFIAFSHVCRPKINFLT